MNCKGCELESNPAECLRLFFVDAKKFVQERKKLIKPTPKAARELKKNGINL